MGYLDVVVPPDIVDYQTSQDVVRASGQNVTLTCSATGVPLPTITWRREENAPLWLLTDEEGRQEREVYSVEGQNLTLWQLQRVHMGAYLCIASNGVPPTVSKRIMLVVNCKYIRDMLIRHDLTVLHSSCSHHLDTLRYHLRGCGPEIDARVHQRVAACIGEFLDEGQGHTARRHLRIHDHRSCPSHCDAPHAATRDQT